MLVMSGLTQDNKLTARTAPEIVSEAKRFLLRLQDLGFKFRGRNREQKIGMEGMLSAIVLDFLRKGEEEKLRIILRRLPEVTTMLGQTTLPLPDLSHLLEANPVPAEKEGGQEGIPSPSKGRIVRKKRKEKGVG
jgi:hypothetical protein